MDPRRGRPVYRHRASMKNSTLRWMIFLASSCIAVWIMLMAFVYDVPFWKASSDQLMAPLSLMVLISGSIFNLIILLSFPLFTSPPFIITTTGIRTPYALFYRSFQRYPEFVEYREIDKIFPQFIIGTRYNDGKKDPRTLHSIVVILKNGKVLELPWGVKDLKKNNFMELSNVLKSLPDTFREKWTDLPEMSQRQKKIALEIKNKRLTDQNPTRAQKLYVFLLSTLFVLIFIPFMVGIVAEGLANIYRVLLIISSVFMIIPIVLVTIKAQQINIEVLKVKASIEILEAYNEKGSVNAIELGEPPAMEFEPVKQEDIEKSMKALDKYNRGLNWFLIIVGSCSFIAGIFIFAYPGPLMIRILGIVLGLVGFALIMYVMVFRGMGDIQLHTTNMNAVLADEVRTRKDILPTGYQTPDWFLITRGKNPVKKDEMDVIRKWTKYTSNKAAGIFVLLFMGGIFLEMLYLPLVIFFEFYPSDILMIFPLLLEIFTVPIGIFFLYRYFTSVYKLNLLGTWEQRSGVRVMDDVLRERWEKAEEERKKAQGG